MKYNQLGRSDIKVSEICLGSMTWGSQNSESEAHGQLDYATGEGVNFIDTAEMYPTTPISAETAGLTEQLICSWLKNHPKRDDLIIATKATGEGSKNFRDGRRVDGGRVPWCALALWSRDRSQLSEVAFTRVARCCSR